MWKILFYIAAYTVATSHAADIYCSSFHGSPPACVFSNITNVGASDEDVTVVGQPITFVDTSLTLIEIKSPMTINFFPKKIFSIFPKLKSITLRNCSLPNLGPSAFGSCDEVNYIEGQYLRFQTLHAGFAQDCAQLQTLIFNWGEITTLDPNALLGLTKLEWLVLYSNKISCIPPGFFSFAKNLIHIQLGSNQITALDANIIFGLSKLNDFYISNNSMTYLPTFSITRTSTSGPIKLDFTLNPIVALDPNFLNTLFPYPNAEIDFSYNSKEYSGTTCFSANSSIIGLANWQTLNSTLSGCYTSWTSTMANTPVSCAAGAITTVATTTSTTITTTTSSSAQDICASNKICRFYLDHANRYTCVLDGVDGVVTLISGTHISPIFTDANVTRIYFTNSYLSRVPPVVFSKFPNVNFLSIANCSLGMFTNATMPVCGPQLAYLDARYNGIFHVSSGAFKYCQRLETIDFTGNPIEILDSAIFALVPSLKKVIFNGAGAE